MSWFERLTGFAEESPEQVRTNLAVEGKQLRSLVNGNTFEHGHLETPALADLRQRAADVAIPKGRIALREVVADVQSYHVDQTNAGALFQVASQFNLLEMVSPYATPERGVGIYEHDHTQGPACAIACGAGTIYRNYFADVNGAIGQSAENQIDCLVDLGAALGNADGHLWAVQNGYALATRRGLAEIAALLRVSTAAEIDQLRQKLRIGIQWQTQVTLDDCSHSVSQLYCSALPVAYSEHPASLWEPFARLVLEASYEAAICAAVWNSAENHNNKLYLTLLGGGAFGNETEWIIEAIERALNIYAHVALDVALISYGSSHPAVRQLVRRLRSG